MRAVRSLPLLVALLAQTGWCAPASPEVSDTALPGTIDPLTTRPVLATLHIPEPAQFQRRLESLAGTAHPRLLLTPARLRRVQEKRASDPVLDPAVAAVLASAEKLLGQPVQTSAAARRETLHRIYDLGLAHHLSSRRDFAERGIRELEAVAALADWRHENDRDFLGVAYHARGLAIGYDWFHDSMTEAQRTTLREALLAKALRPALHAYEHPEGSTNAASHWIRGAHNWNPTCNGSMAIAALALADSEPALAARILNYSLRALGAFLPEYCPDGAWPEGVDYWYYATNSLVELLDALHTGLGDDFGISATPGLAQTGYFALFMNSAHASFNWGDAQPTRRITDELFWFASHYRDPALQAMALAVNRAGTAATQTAGHGLHHSPARRLLWYEPVPLPQANFPMARAFRGVEAAGLCTDWTDPQAVYVGVKGGTNPAIHGALSLGTFVIDAGGQRWIRQLGMDKYSLPGYWDSRPQIGQRWSYYRLRAEGQNTLAIATDTGADQAIPAFAPLSLAEEAGTARATIDLTASLVRPARKAIRSVALDAGGTVTVTDEVSLAAPATLAWGVHTAAQVTPSADGRELFLAQGGQRLRVALVAGPPGARFVLRPATPRPRTDLPARENPNDGTQRIEILLPDTTHANLTVTFALLAPPAP